MRSVIATEVIPKIMHARRGGRVLSAQAVSGCAHLTVSPWSRTQPFAGRQNPPQCHLLDYTIHSAEMRSVDFTAAAKHNSTLLAGDATDASLSGGEMSSVIQTDAPKYRRSGRANSVPKYGP